MKPLGRNQRLLLEAIADGRRPAGRVLWTREKLYTTVAGLEERGLVVKIGGSGYCVTEAGRSFLSGEMFLRKE